jgi:thioredoxin-related protein
MTRFIFLLFIVSVGFSCSKSKFDAYSKLVGFNPEKATILISLENCSYCFGEYQETVQGIDRKLFNVVIISSQIKKASLFLAPDQKSVFVDNEKHAIRLGLIESLPVILLPNGQRLEIFHQIN